MRVVSVVGARPQFVKLAPVHRAFERAGIDHAVVHTGQHYASQLSDVFFADLGLPNPALHLGVGSGTHGVQTGAILSAMDQALVDLCPDAVVVYGDTNSTLAAAVCAAKMQLPIAHVEAGLRSFNRAMPEEHNRILTDHASDLCLAPTALAMTNLATEGLADRSMLVGDVMVEICHEVRDRVRDSPIELTEIGDEPFVIATLHRAENTDNPDRLRMLLRRLASLPLPVLLAAHPRLLAKASEYGIELDSGAVRVVNALAYPTMVSAVLRSSGVVTDSGGLQKEALLLGTVCTTLRSETEWVETLDDGWNVLDPDGAELSHLAARTPPASVPPSPFGQGDAAHLVSEAVISMVGSRDGMPAQ
ncbi:non-hydrolyzing UDP-N-acetylglucosamine 2-epimerase [Nocardioides aquiterrae]